MTESAELLVEQARAVSLSHYDAVNSCDWDSLRATCATDVVLHGETSLHGPDALVAYLSELHRHFPGLHIRVRETACSATAVVCENEYVAPAGAAWELKGRSCTIHVVSGDRIVQIRQYYTPAPDDRVGGGTIITPQLAEEQAALRRVSSLVARATEADEVFAAVAREIGLLIGADATSLFQFYDDDSMRLVSVWSRDDAKFPVGDRRPMNTPILELRRTGVPMRFETLPEGSPFLEEARAYGIEMAIALPLPVEDSVWGMVFATSKTPGMLRPDAEDRAMRFTSLAGIAMAHSRARTALASSRARVVAAADASRRQVQRDLHDGAQQRLMHAAVELKLARAAASGHDCAAVDSIDQALAQIDSAKAELHDLVRGVLPGALTRHGLRAAINSLVESLPMQVEVDVGDARLPASVETAAYFVIAER